ncbi:Uma2 family endonuclease [Meiothermus sp. CFH 77666]|nr:Uma2 family endonuclease [Meiothermus sp. CFH 77666]
MPECAILIDMVTLKKWTVDELLAMDRAGLLDPSKRIELINGEVYEMGIGESHAGTIIRMVKLLEQVFGERALVSSQNPLRMGDLGLPQPDVALLKPRDDFYTTAYPTPADAFLVIEVADSSIKYDREIKLPSYAENGVREVWIVNLNAGHTEVYRDPQDGEYLTKFTVQKGAAVAPAAFPSDAIIPLP